MRANRIVASALLAWGLLMVCLVPAPLWARRAGKPRASAKDQQVAATLLASGSAALVAKNLGQAKIDFEDAFRKNPAPEVLFQLGKLAEAEGRLVVAQDILRRYLHETAGDPEGSGAKRSPAGDAAGGGAEWGSVGVWRPRCVGSR
jgi:tetratricopeptide (TPR) repeat protein